MALGVLEILPYKRHQHITRPENSPNNNLIVFVELLGAVARFNLSPIDPQGHNSPTVPRAKP